MSKFEYTFYDGDTGEVDADHYQKRLNPNSGAYEYHFYSDKEETELTHLLTVPALWLVGDPIEVERD